MLRNRPFSKEELAIRLRIREALSSQNYSTWEGPDASSDKEELAVDLYKQLIYIRFYLEKLSQEIALNRAEIRKLPLILEDKDKVDSDHEVDFSDESIGFINNIKFEYKKLVSESKQVEVIDRLINVFRGLDNDRLNELFNLKNQFLENEKSFSLEFITYHERTNTRNKINKAICVVIDSL